MKFREFPIGLDSFIILDNQKPITITELLDSISNKVGLDRTFTIYHPQYGKRVSSIRGLSAFVNQDSFSSNKSITPIGADTKIPIYIPNKGISYTSASSIANLSLGEVPKPTEPILGYGLLYNWYAATDERGVAPSGFRVATEADVNILLAEVGVNSAVKLRSTDVAPNVPGWVTFTGTPGSDDFGFAAQGSGDRFHTNLDGYGGFKQRFEMMLFDELNDVYSKVLTLGIFSTNGQINTYTKWFGGSIRCVSDVEPSTELVQDADGNSYSWVQIGSQYWLAQSLRTTSYNNGDSIITNLNLTDWQNTTNGAWAYPNGDSNLPI